MTTRAGAEQGAPGNPPAQPPGTQVATMRRFSRPDPSADRFLEIAEQRLRRLEEASHAARADLGAEVKRLASNARGPGEGAGLPALAEELIEHAAAVDTSTKRLREQVSSLRTPDQKQGPQDADALASREEALEAGMTVVARRMALTGHSEAEIAEAFSELGLHASPAAVLAALGRDDG